MIGGILRPATRHVFERMPKSPMAGGHFAAEHQMTAEEWSAESANSTNVICEDELKPDDFGAWVPDAVVSMFGDGDVEPTVDILADYLDEVQRFHPFGRAFEAPSLLLKVNLEQVDFVFMGARQQHLKLMLSDSVEVILWSYSDLLADSLVRVSPASDDERHVRDYLMYRGDDPCLELKGDFQYNVYGGRRSIQFGVNKDNVLSGGGVVHA